MYYLECDLETGVNPDGFAIFKSLGSMRYCGCDFSYKEGVLKLERRQFYQGDFELPKCDYDGFQYFEDFTMERFYIMGLGDFPLDQLDLTDFDPDSDTEFDIVEIEKEE